MRTTLITCAVFFFSTVSFFGAESKKAPEVIEVESFDTYAAHKDGVSAIYYLEAVVVSVGKKEVSFYDPIRKKTTKAIKNDDEFGGDLRIGVLKKQQILVLGKAEKNHVNLIGIPNGTSIKKVASPNLFRLGCSLSGNLIWMWEEIDTQRQRGVSKDPPISNPMRRQSEFGSDGKRTLKVLDKDFKAVCMFHTGYETSDFFATFSSKEKLIATSVGPLIWEISSGKIKKKLTPEDPNPFVKWMTFAGDDETLVTLYQNRVESRLSTYSVESGKEVRTFSLGDQKVSAICASPDRSKIAFGTYEGQMALFDVATGKELFSMLTTQGIKSVAFSPNGLCLVYGCGMGRVDEKGELNVIDLGESRTSRRITDLKGRISTVAFLDDDRFATGDLQGEVTLWKIRRGGKN